MTTFASDLKIQDKLHIPNNVTFGVEIEFENASFKNIEQKMDRSKLGGLLSNGWILKQDGSLFKYKDTIGMGGELTSPILHNTVEDYKEIKEACRIIQECHGLATENCGGHIHIGSKIFGYNKTYYIRLMKLWLVYENEIVRFSMGENEVLRPLIDKYAKTNAYIFSHIDSLKDEKLCDIFENLGSDKDLALSLRNLRKYAEYHTLEVRCPAGTINPDIWENNINFFVNFLLACKDDSKDWDKIDRLYEETIKEKKLFHILDYNFEKAVELSDFIFDKTIDKFNFLVQYKKDSKVLIR